MINQNRIDAHGNSLPPNIEVDRTPKGTRYYYVRLQVNGRRPKRSTGVTEEAGATRAGWKKMLDAARRIQNELAGDSVAAPAGVMTFAKFWRDEYRPNVTVRTKTPLPRVEADAAEFGDDKLIKWWLEPNQLGRLAMSAITVSYCLTLLAKREARKFRRTRSGPWLTPKPSTILRELGLLGAMWNYAIEREQVERGLTGVAVNPWPFVVKRIEKPDENENAKDVLSAADEVKLRAVLTPLYDRWLTFMLDSGVRIAGCTRINPDHDLEWKDGEPVAVTVVLKTKGKKKRTLRLPLMLQRTRDTIKTQLSETGHWWNAHYSRYPEILRRKCLAAGIGYLSPHKLRHTFATRYLQTPGSDLYTLSLLLGHKNTAVTQRVYAHLITADLRARSVAWVQAQEGPSPGAPALPGTAAAGLRLATRRA